MTPALELRGIEKRFGPVHALRGADFTLAAGEVHALLGENGAGKSTLMHVAGGLLASDRGQVLVRGRPVALRSPRAARGAGIGLVHQHFTAIPAFSVAENVALAAGWQVHRPRQLGERVRDLAAREGLELEPGARTGDLPVGARQRLEVLKALAADTTILLLDEPTAVLAPPEADEVLRRLRMFAAGGRSAVLITHKLDEALAVADRVTVLRDGRVVLSATTRTLSAADLSAAMIGAADESPITVPTNPGVRAGAHLIACRKLSVAREDGRGIALRDATLDVGGGEIVGVAGVEGSGHRELLRAVAGIRPADGGMLEVTQPVAFIPEDRTTEGLVGEMSLAENVALGFGPTAPWVRLGWMDWSAVRRRAGEMVTRYGIRAPGVAAPVATLSGGNQQKLVIARALECEPRVVVAENPTRGLDVRATRAVWGELQRAARGGAAVLAWASDLDELIAHADRLLVVSRGTVRETPIGADRSQVGAMMLGADVASD